MTVQNAVSKLCALLIFCAPLSPFGFALPGNDAGACHVIRPPCVTWPRCQRQKNPPCCDLQQRGTIRHKLRLGFGLLAVAQFVTSQGGDDRQAAFVEVAEERDVVINHIQAQSQHRIYDV